MNNSPIGIILSNLGSIETRLAVHFICTDPLFGPAHLHDGLYQITHLITGGCRVRIGEETFHATEGDTLVIPAGVVHESFDEADTRLELIEIKFEPARGVDPGLRRLPLRARYAGDESPALPSALDRVVEARMSESPEQGWLSRIRLAEVLELLSETPQTGFDSTPETQVERRINQAVRYIMRHFAEELSVGGLAEEVGMSESHFSTCFRRVTRQSPGELIIQRRIHQAKELLRLTNLSISRISLECGFSSPQYFSRLFRRREGVTPTAYRGVNRESKNSAQISAHPS